MLAGRIGMEEVELAEPVVVGKALGTGTADAAEAGTARRLRIVSIDPL